MCGLSCYGLYSCGLYSHGLHNCGLYSYGLYSYGLGFTIICLYLEMGAYIVMAYMVVAYSCGQ